MTNLDNYTKCTNSDWAMWVKMVKKVYKDKGHNLTQQQALIVAKDSYPGKGNVINRNPKELDRMEQKIPINDELPPNPVRRKKEPKPKEKPEVYRREREPPRNRRLNYSSEDSPPRRYKKTRDYTPPRRDDTPPRRRRRDDTPPSSFPRSRKQRRDETPSPRRRRYKKDYESDEDSPPRRRKDKR